MEIDNKFRANLLYIFQNKNFAEFSLLTNFRRIIFKPKANRTFSLIKCVMSKPVSHSCIVYILPVGM